MTESEWLEALGELTDEHRKPLDEPFICEGWTCASNGKVLLAVRGKLTGRENPLSDSAAEVVRQAVTGRGFDAAATIRTDVATIREWADVEMEAGCLDCEPGASDEVCETCEGTGDVECYCGECGLEHFKTCDNCHGDGGFICLTCEGEGVMPINEYRGRVGTIHGRPFNKAYLALLVRRLPDEPVEIVVPARESRGVRLVGSEWRAFAMPLRMSVLDEEDSDPLPAKVPA